MSKITYWKVIHVIVFLSMFQLIGCQNMTSNKNFALNSDKFLNIEIYQEGKKIEGKLKALVDDYVMAKRNWALGDYYLTEIEVPDTHSYEVMVHYKGDYVSSTPGRGKSFIVCVDLKAMKILKELALQ